MYEDEGAKGSKKDIRERNKGSACDSENIKGTNGKHEPTTTSE